MEELVEERADAKARRDYAAADAIRDQLNAMGISVDDRSREWRVADAPYARARGDAADVDVATVEALVAERSQAKIAGEYDTADAIRDRLRNEFGVSVDDRVKEWVVDGRPAAAPAAPEPVVEDEPFVVVDAPTEEPPRPPRRHQRRAGRGGVALPRCRAPGPRRGGLRSAGRRRLGRGLYGGQWVGGRVALGLRPGPWGPGPGRARRPAPSPRPWKGKCHRS